MLYALVLGMGPSLAAAPLTFYVAPNGNDQSSGQQPDQPLATLAAALKAARQARATEGPDAAVTISLKGGQYSLTAPIVLTPEDSGASAQKPLLITAFGQEKPVLSGGRRITGWNKVAGTDSLWETRVPEVSEGRWYFRELFVNGQRKQRARTPNQGFFRIQGESPQTHPVQLKFKPGDIKKAWAADGDVEVIAYLSWADFRLQIRAVDESNRVATLSGDPASSNRENDAEYYVENAPDGLDVPGEWYLNRKTGVLRYWAQAGEDLNQADVVAPRLTELLRFTGDFQAKKPVQHVILRGLTFSHTDWTLGDHGYTDVQAAFNIRGNVFGEGVAHCTIEGCTFTHLGGYALDFGRACQDIHIEHNEIGDVGAGGIRLGEPQVRTEPFDLNQGNEISDNHIHHLGEVYKPAIGVFVLQSGHNQVVHNDIHDLYYTAISVGWNWGYQETPCHDNLVAYNHLHDIGKGLLSDMGAIYTLGIQKGTIIRNNLIHDVNAFTYGGWGIYPDEGSTEILIENNVVYRTKSAGFHQHYGRENVVRNNVFAFGKEHQLMRTRAEAHLSFTFTNNIVYYDSGDLLGSNWSEDRFVMEQNLYFDARSGAASDTLRMAGTAWSDWQKRGHDTNSVVADPLFVDAKHYDFRLQPGSPALGLGIKSIDVSQVGVRPVHGR